MKKNEGNKDRLIRVFVAIALFVGAFYLEFGSLSNVLYVLGAIVLLTAATGYCGLYSFLGINTCRLKKEENHKE